MKRSSDANARENVRGFLKASWRGEPVAYWISVAALLVVGVALRLLWLERRPFHHDEGVNGFFLERLLHNGIYHYDPENYHGPTLYFVSLPFVILLGLNSLAVRLVTVVFGVAALWLTLGFRRVLSRAATLTTLGLLALSPGAVFFSRYFIHEILLISFTIGAIVAILRFSEARRLSMLLAVSVFAALSFATKETAFITIGVLAIASACAWTHVALHRRLFGSSAAEGASAAPEPAAAQLAAIDRALAIASALSVFLLINIVLYSSFFTYPAGVRGALQTFMIWRKTGETAHVHPWATYLNWLFRAEAPTLVLGAIGVVVAFWRAESRRIVWLAYWAVGMIAAYSIIKYKTPWLILNLSLPLAVLGGYAVQSLIAGRARWPWLVGALSVAFFEAAGLLVTRVPWRVFLADARGATRLVLESIGDQWTRYAGDRWLCLSVCVPLLVTLGCLISAALAFFVRRSPWIAVAPALVLAAGVSLYQTIEMSFDRYDDDRYVYVYAHTRRGFLELVERIERLTNVSAERDATAMSVTSAEHWPLSWYLRDCTQVAYHGKLTGLDTAKIVIGHANQDSALRSRLGEAFTRLGMWPLRPGVDLVLYARADLARQAGFVAQR